MAGWPSLMATDVNQVEVAKWTMETGRQEDLFYSRANKETYPVGIRYDPVEWPVPHRTAVTYVAPPERSL